jgi:hypothetical protein
LTYFAFNYSSPSKALAQVDQTQTPEDGSLAQRYSEVRIDTSKGLSPEQQVRELLFNSTKRASEPQGARSSSQMMAEQQPSANSSSESEPEDQYAVSKIQQLLAKSQSLL